MSHSVFKLCDQELVYLNILFLESGCMLYNKVFSSAYSTQQCLHKLTDGMICDNRQKF